MEDEDDEDMSDEPDEDISRLGATSFGVRKGSILSSALTRAGEAELAWIGLIRPDAMGVGVDELEVRPDGFELPRSVSSLLATSSPLSFGASSQSLAEEMNGAVLRPP